MKRLLILTAILATTGGACFADDKTPPISEAQKARIKSQMESLSKQKGNAAAAGTQAAKEQAARDAKVIDTKVHDAKARVDRDAESFNWFYGKDAVAPVATAKKKAIEQQAALEKEKIANAAKRRASEHANAAAKSTQNIKDSVTGLKSQVARKGQYGLQAEGTNLHVRNYGTSK